MINIARWKVVTILTLCFVGVLYALPNLMTGEARDKMLALPSWLPTKTINLGLDLQGGSHLQLAVDVDYVVRERVQNLIQAARPELRKAQVGYTRLAAVPNGVRVTLRDGQDPAPVRKILRDLDREMSVTVDQAAGTVEALLSEASIKTINDQTIDQSIEIVRRRVDETGTREPIIQRQGDDRIIVQLPGIDNPEYIKEILGKTAQLTFHLVDTGAGGVTGGVRTLPMKDTPGQTIGIVRRPMLTGDMLTNAQSTFQNGAPVVSFTLNAVGARRFCEVTRNNQGQPFAIVLDEEVISAPRINEAICGGSAVITGQFTVQETSDTALLLRAGALPAPLQVMEERTVGPSLGADSVEAGKMACLMAMLFVVIMMIGCYGLFGIFASIALTLNVTFIIAIISVFQATLTLPGIAGIVLTIGMAVDANVLVYERIKEELKLGRSVVSAIETGYSKAMTSITDSNLTSVIAALILFSLGSGPIKGFAVTMAIGIATSYFSALSVTRLMVVAWLRAKRPTAIKV